ncbi:MAG: hypothetical protein AB8F26_09290 [Phycisphaerales bacterium]
MTTIFKNSHWMMAVLWSYTGLFGWGLVVPILTWFAIEVYRASQDKRQAKAPPRSRTSRILVSGFCVSLVAAGNASLGMASERISRHLDQSRQYGLDIYRNHDLTRITGQAIRVLVLQQAGQAESEEQGYLLKTFADEFPAHWTQLVDDKDPRIQLLSEPELAEFIATPRAESLNTDVWRSIISSEQKHILSQQPSSNTISKVSDSLASSFGISLREALKEDYFRGGKAWPSMQLDVYSRMLSMASAARDGSDRIESALGDLFAALDQVASEVSVLNEAVIEARASQDAHAAEIHQRLEAVNLQLGNLSNLVTFQQLDNIYDTIIALKAGNLSAGGQQRRELAQIARLRINNALSQIPPEKLPADLEDWIEESLQGSTAIQRFAVFARLGMGGQTEGLVKEIEVVVDGLAEPEKYEYFLARADSYWLGGNYWHAAGWYAQAMAISINDPHAVYRAATSAMNAPGRETYASDLILAQSWIQRCLRRISPEKRPIPGAEAKLLSILSSVLVHRGMVSESITPARRARDIVIKGNEESGEIDSVIMAEVAETFRSSGQLDEAQHAIQWAAKKLDLHLDPVSEATLYVRQVRSWIRLDLGDLEGALADINWCVDHVDNSSVVQEWRLALYLSIRSRIKLRINDAAGAYTDINESINWFEMQPVKDSRSLAIRYAQRASILAAQGDYEQAIHDITASISWFEAQEPRDGRALALRYGQRTTIRAALGDLAGAESDIASSLAWYESQYPRDWRGVANRRSTRAAIRLSRGNLTGAEEDLTSSIDWYQSEEVRNENQLMILLRERAEVRVQLGDERGAEEDLSQCIAWYEEQGSSFQRDLAVSRWTRSTLRNKLGDFSGAINDIDSTISWFDQQSPRDERAIAIFYKKRSEIFLSLGDLVSAEKNIAYSISWFENNISSDMRSLSVMYATRASIRLELDIAEEAKDDIDKAIKWFESSSPPNNHAVAIYLQTRAKIERALGNDEAARVDLDRSIEWFEGQTPRNERSLANRYAIRAAILRDRGDLAGAMADIERTIRWYTEKSPTSGRGLAIQMAVRATIKQALGDLAGAEHDVTECLLWFESQTPSDSRALSTYYGARAQIRRHLGDEQGFHSDLQRSQEHKEK